MKITITKDDGTTLTLENVEGYNVGGNIFITHYFNNGESVFHGTLIEDMKDYIPR